jgi:hypothetical protein
VPAIDLAGAIPGVRFLPVDGIHSEPELARGVCRPLPSRRRQPPTMAHGQPDRRQRPHLDPVQAMGN